MKSTKKTKKPRKSVPLVKPREWREALAERRVDVTYDDLAGIVSRTKAALPEKRKVVPVAELFVAEKVFQWRGENSDIQAEQRLMRELMRVLKLGRSLAPVLVIAIGGTLYVVDGHHRLAAYGALGQASVPVLHFSGTLEDAWLKSLSANTADKLPMVLKDKWEAAFKLVKRRVSGGLDMTWEKIAHAAVVGPRLVYKMQSAFIMAQADHADAGDWSWGETLGKLRDKTTKYEAGSVEFREEAARKMADQILKAVGMNLTANPDITALALGMISEELPRALIEEWTFEVRDVLIQQARAARGDEAEQALNLAFTALSAAMEKAGEMTF